MGQVRIRALRNADVVLTRAYGKRYEEVIADGGKYANEHLLACSLAPSLGCKLLSRNVSNYRVTNALRNKNNVNPAITITHLL